MVVDAARRSLDGVDMMDGQGNNYDERRLSLVDDIRYIGRLFTSLCISPNYIKRHQGLTANHCGGREVIDSHPEIFGESKPISTMIFNRIFPHRCGTVPSSLSDHACPSKPRQL